MAVDPTIDYAGETPAGEPPAMNAKAYGEADDANVEDARKANVQRILSEVKAAKKHWKPDFDRMREDVYFAQGNHWPDAMPGLEDPRLKIDVTTRHLQLRTAALYAKNPTVVARRKEQIDFLVWDETPESAVQAQATMQAVMAAGGPEAVAVSDPGMAAMVGEAAILLDDIKEGLERKRAMDKLGRTLELVFRHQIDNVNALFKTQIKAMIPRSLTTCVGYVKLDYQRQLGRKPGYENRLADMRDRLAEMQQRLRDWKEGEATGDYDQTRAEYDELETQVNAIAQEPKIILKEGLLFQFPRSWSIIPDKKCRELLGFSGSDWVAEEAEMSPEDIKQTYQVNVGMKYKRYTKQYDGQIVEAVGQAEHEQCYCVVYTVYNRRSGLVYVVCDGYDDFLKPPAAPEIQFPFFYPWFAYVPNHVESARSPFPKSDVRLMMPLQQELNRTAESLRQHRIANAPKYMHDASAFEEDEVLNVQNTPPHESVAVKAIGEGKKIADMLVAIPKQPIDPNVYSTDVIYEGLMRVIGSQEANFGQPKGSDRTTATGESIAEASRLSSQQSNADDLDDLLNLVSRNAGVVLLTNMTKEQALRIAGRGGVWLQLDPEEAADQVYLEIVAGSSGRPNQAQEVAVMKETMPLVFQIPGVSPQKLLEELLRTMNARWRPSDFMDPKITQSIVSMNRGAAPMMGAEPQNDPGQQGPNGAQNAPKDNASTKNNGSGIPDKVAA